MNAKIARFSPNQIATTAIKICIDFVPRRATKIPRLASQQNLSVALCAKCGSHVRDMQQRSCSNRLRRTVAYPSTCPIRSGFWIIRICGIMGCPPSPAAAPTIRTRDLARLLRRRSCWHHRRKSRCASRRQSVVAVLWLLSRPPSRPAPAWRAPTFAEARAGFETDCQALLPQVPEGAFDENRYSTVSPHGSIACGTAAVGCRRKPATVARHASAAPR
jgi:hypothetical protein